MTIMATAMLIGLFHAETLPDPMLKLSLPNLRPNFGQVYDLPRPFPTIFDIGTELSAIDPFYKRLFERLRKQINRPESSEAPSPPTKRPLRHFHPFMYHGKTVVASNRADEWMNANPAILDSRLNQFAMEHPFLYYF